MSDVQRCDACGAHNPAQAGWCTQCYQRLAGAAAEAAVPTSVAAGTPTPASATSHATSPGTPPAPLPPAPPPPVLPVSRAPGLLPIPPDERPTAPGPTETLEAGDGRFRRSDDGIDWQCEVCEQWNVIERPQCSVCATPFLRSRADDEVTRPTIAPALLVVATVALPGAGHALLADWGQAFFRAVLGVVWGAGGLWLLTYALSSGQPVLPAVPLLVGWLVLVAASVNDVLIAGGAKGRVLLQGRVLLWLVVGVIGATIGAAFIGAIAAVAG